MRLPFVIEQNDQFIFYVDGTEVISRLSNYKFCLQTNAEVEVIKHLILKYNEFPPDWLYQIASNWIALHPLETWEGLAQQIELNRIYIESDNNPLLQARQEQYEQIAIKLIQAKWPNLSIEDIQIKANEFYQDSINWYKLYLLASQNLLRLRANGRLAKTVRINISVDLSSVTTTLSNLSANLTALGEDLTLSAYLEHRNSPLYNLFAREKEKRQALLVCNNCKFYHGGHGIICAIHPSGPNTNSCIDWEEK